MAPKSVCLCRRLSPGARIDLEPFAVVNDARSLEGLDVVAEEDGERGDDWV